VIYTPEADWPVMNALAVQFGESGEAEAKSFRSVTRARNGVGYSYMNTRVTDRVVTALGSTALPLPALTLFDFDPENPPAYNGQTIIALDVPAGAIEAAYGFV
jgi:hypothetical protein